VQQRIRLRVIDEVGVSDQAEQEIRFERLFIRYGIFEYKILAIGTLFPFLDQESDICTRV
jgi:hypothetical protein